MKGVKKCKLEVRRLAASAAKSGNENDYPRQAEKFLAKSDQLSASMERPIYMTGLKFLHESYGSGRYGGMYHDDGFIYKDCFYRVAGTYTEKQKELMIYEHEDEERKYFEKLHAKHLSPEAIEASKKRPTISEAVRIAVWRRDNGKCVECGCQENLEYDHVIPIDKGGASTVRNIQLLCITCNRKKGNRIDEVSDFQLST